MKQPVHHVPEKGPASLLAKLDATPSTGMRAVGKPVWLRDRTALHASNRIGMVIHNLREHVPGKRFFWGGTKSLAHSQKRQ